MPETFTAFDVYDVRFPTSEQLDGSDALNPDPDYSMAYVIVRTSGGDCGYGFVFTIGRGTEIEVAAIRAVERLVAGLEVDAVLDDMGAFSRRLVHDSHLRWLGPEKGAVHMAIGAVVNAVWDLYARRADKPLWKLLADMEPEQLVSLVDFRHLTDVLRPSEALEILQAARAGREAREAELLLRGFPAYTTSAGWLGYSDDKVKRLVDAALGDGFRHLKLKVGRDLDDDVRRVAMVRDLIGPDVALSVDANQSWDVDEAIDAIRRLTPFDLHWVEEPTSPDDVLGHMRITNDVESGSHRHGGARRQPSDLQATFGGRGHLRLPDRRLPRGRREREHRRAVDGGQVRDPHLSACGRCGAVRAGSAPRDVRLRSCGRKPRWAVDRVRRPSPRALRRAGSCRGRTLCGPKSSRVGRGASRGGDREVSVLRGSTRE